MRRLFIPIAALLLSDALLLMAHGLQLTIMPLRADFIGFTPAQVGFTGSAYFIGFVFGGLITPHIVRRVGHIRSFAVLATVFSSLVLLFYPLEAFVGWLLLRLGTGACVCGLYMIIESWLNERSTRENRGTVLSVYTMINLTMIMAGQLLLNTSTVEAPTLFGLAAILFSLSILPVALTTSLAPAPIQSVNIDLRRIWQRSHVGLMGAIGSGLTTGAYWSMGPLYARGVGLERLDITLFLAACVLGGALLQLPIGRLSDHYDRRLVVFCTALAGAAVSAVLGFAPALTAPMIIGLGLLWGGSCMTIYAVCLAHANDRAPSDEFLMVGSGMLLTYGISSALGSPLASLAMDLIGPRGLFVFSALSTLTLALAVAHRRQTHVMPVLDETAPFRNVVRTSSMVLEMDPRLDDHPDTENAA